MSSSSSLPQPVAAPGPATVSPSRSVLVFMQQWVGQSWVDIVWMLVVGGIALGIHLAPIPVTRTFPITFNHDDMINLDLAYPDRGWIINTWVSGVITITCPTAIYALCQIRIRSAWDASNAIMGTIWAVLLATLFQTAIKTFVGGIRPNFLSICMPDVDLVNEPGHNKTGLNGVGFRNIMYTIEVCTQPDKQKLKMAMMSFPSGHSAAGFAAFGFLFLWLNAKLKVWADYRPAYWKLTITMAPLLFALLHACILNVDAVHHWHDIAAGSLIGIVAAPAAYRASYAAIWDWRYNHLPLQGGEAFQYGAEGDVDYTTLTLTQRVGWATKKDWLQHDPYSAQSRAVLAQPIATPMNDTAARERNLPNGRAINE